MPARPRRRGRRSGRVFWYVLIGLFVVGIIGAGLAWKFGPSMFASQREDLIYHTVKEEPLELTVVERGTLESARNADLKCMVRSRSTGAQAATSIRWIIDDGSHVKKGDKVIELDKSYLEDQRLTQEIAVEKAKAEVIKAEGNLRIQQSQNQSDLDKALADLAIAELDLRKYLGDRKDEKGNPLEGEYKRDLDKFLGDVKEAESNVEAWRERASWSRRMVEKKFKSASEAEADEAKLKSAELTLAKAKNELELLTLTRAKELTSRDSAVKLAKQALERVRIQNAAKEATAKTDLETAKKALEQEEWKLKDIKEQISYCTLIAPKDGMVVYYIDERARGGFGQQSVVQQGEPVREGQTLIRIPDLENMLVNTRVHEAMVSRVRPGMKVGVRVDAARERVLRGSVKSVATIAIQLDWRSAGDVKMYQTMIQIDESVPGLKPGMSAEVSIHVDATDKPVPTVPVQAVVGGPEMGTKRTVFVKGAGGQPEEREVEIGLSNDKVAEIRSGLKAGDEVVLNPKVLVGDRVKTRSPGELSTKEAGAPANGNGAGGPSPAGSKPGGLPAGPGASPGAGPGAAGPGGQTASGPSAGGPGAGGGRRGGFNPAMLEDPEVRKRAMENPFVQKAMKDQGVDDPRKVDWSKVQRPAGAGPGGPGGGRPAGGGPGGTPN